MAEITHCEQLARDIGAGESKLIPRIFETLVDDKEARLLLAASPPATVEELAERTGLAAAEVEAMIDPLFQKGLLFKSRKSDGFRYYRVRHVLQFHDATVVADNPSPRMIALWREYMTSEWGDYAAKMGAALPQSVMRVIPINVSLQPNTQILAFEDVASQVKAATTLAVTRCSCRVIDGSCGAPLEVCLQIDRAAEYALERGTGRQLSKEEAIRILEQCEVDGLVHVAENRKSHGHVICNCCRDCCMNWVSAKSASGPLVAPSRFRAVVDAEECNGCELCLERCFFDALSMSGEISRAAVHQEKCMGCGVCQVVCPTDAISLAAVRAEEFVPA